MGNEMSRMVKSVLTHHLLYVHYLNAKCYVLVFIVRTYRQKFETDEKVVLRLLIRRSKRRRANLLHFSIMGSGFAIAHHAAFNHNSPPPTTQESEEMES